MTQGWTTLPLYSIRPSVPSKYIYEFTLIDSHLYEVSGLSMVIVVKSRPPSTRKPLSIIEIRKLASLLVRATAELTNLPPRRKYEIILIHHHAVSADGSFS